MGRIKKNVKVAMRAIVEYGYSYMYDDSGDWGWDDENNESFHNAFGFNRDELKEAFHRLAKKLPKRE